jgi:hypothetical protein
MNTATLPVVQAFERPEICAKCGGECCKTLPGITSPEDWGAPNRNEMKRRLSAAFRSKNYAIDCWEGDPRPGKSEPGINGLFVRPATTHAVGKLYDYSWGGECVFLTECGCSLQSERRPFGCRTLEPVSPRERMKHGCKEHGGDKREMGIAWLPYHDVLKAAAKESTC